MKTRLVRLPALLLLSFILHPSSFILSAHAQGTAFTYQGRLNDNGQPANGSYDLSFSVYKISSGGGAAALIAGPLTNAATAVSNGLFTVTLDFGSGVFHGIALWLDISVRTNGNGAFAELSPRQPLTPSPYAIYSSGSGVANSAYSVAANSIFAASLNTVGAPASGQVLSYTGNSLIWTTPSAGGGGGWSLTGNSNTIPGLNFLGTADNEPLEFHVNGMRALRLEPDSSGNGYPNVIGGSSNNVASPGSFGATIGGGYFNAASSRWNTIAGGVQNTTAQYADTVGGGSGNTASGGSSTVAGGFNNQATQEGATVGGGGTDGPNTPGNIASGKASTVPGGLGNQANGDYSFAAGYSALANNAGSFVWADASGGPFASTADNQFSVRAYGGVRFFTTNYSRDMTLDGYRVLTTADGAGGGGGSTNGWSLTGNAGANPASGDFLGTVDTNALELRVFSARALRLEPDSSGGGQVNVIGGSSQNAVSPGAVGSTIGGGHYNQVFSSYSTVAGGLYNTAAESGGQATVGGGYENHASDTYATVAGGYQNRASANSAAVGGGALNNATGIGAFVGGGGNDGLTLAGNAASGRASTVAGGLGNTNSGDYATIGGGYGNLASGNYSTVAGGWNNFALGAYSFAGGYNATANHDGSFVWSDSTGGAVDGGANSFTVQASGGIHMSAGDQGIVNISVQGLNDQLVLQNDKAFLSISDAGFYVYNNGRVTVSTGGSSGAYIAAGDSTWNSICDRNAKENLAPVDTRQVLERLAAIPISTWNYKQQKNPIRHLGPMAQDFHAAFELGVDDKHISTLDEEGVALAAIQGLNEKVESGKQKAESRIEKLEAENAELKARLEKLEQLMTRQIGGAK